MSQTPNGSSKLVKVFFSSPNRRLRVATFGYRISMGGAVGRNALPSEERIVLLKRVQLRRRCRSASKLGRGAYDQRVG